MDDFGWAWAVETPSMPSVLKSSRHPYFFACYEDEVTLFSACCSRYLSEDIPSAREQYERNDELDRPWSCVECHRYFFHLQPNTSGRGTWAGLEPWLRLLLEPLSLNVLEVELEAYEVAGLLRRKQSEFGI